jgi:periplasmic divalent cation tolerance protein
MTDVLLVFTACPDAGTASRIAGALLEQRLAACVSEGPPVRSHYRWQGAVESALEIPLQVKCTADRYEQVEQLIRELHPYELPEIIALPVAAGLAAYLGWVTDETRPPRQA